MRLTNAITADSGIWMNFLYALYSKEKKYIDDKRHDAIQKAKNEGKFKGRKKLKLDSLILSEVMNSYEAGKISEAEGMKRLGISRSTFERRYKEFSKRH